MENTSNYQLNKPAQNEKVNIGLINDNMDIIDQVLQENSAELDAHMVDATIHVTLSDKDNWNDTISHVSDTIKHITPNERSTWNEAKSHADSEHARIDATKTENSETNGNIKINDEEITVYVHPAGTNPHGTTKSDLELDEVENKSSSQIRSEITKENITDALAYIPDTPDEVNAKISEAVDGITDGLQEQLHTTEITGILVNGLPDGQKSFSDDWTVLTSTDSEGRTLTKTYTGNFSKCVTELKNSDGLVIGRMTKTFDNDGKIISNIEIN